MIEIRKKLLIVVILILALLVGSFGSTLSKGSSDITVTDARGETINFESSPERIISFMPSNTEILFYLDVGDRVVGVDDYSNYPKEVEGLPTVGDAFSVDYEKIASLSPDVVVIPFYNTEAIENLEDVDIKVVATASTSVSDVYSDMELLGEMCGVKETAEHKVRELKNQMDDITADARDIPFSKRSTLLYITGVEPIYTAGNDTFQHTLFVNAGFNNIASNKSGWYTISEEEIISDNPDVIIAPERLNESIKELKEKDTWQDINAVKNDNIFFVDEDIVSRPSPRIIDGQEELVDINQEIEDIGKEDEETIPSLGVSILIPALATAALIYKKHKRS
ncbi:MAG: ABC transporter substrate-binding protein [Thermoplasmatota archaeon]